MKWPVTKAAALVLVWNFCLSFAVWMFDWFTAVFDQQYSNTVGNNRTAYSFLSYFPNSVIFLALPLSGWLADQRFGNFKVFRAGCVLMFLGSVLACVCILPVNNLHYNQSWFVVVGPSALFLSFSGAGACLVTVFQLGLDQMPDASSTGITNYILLFTITFGAGFWLSDSLRIILIFTSCTVLPCSFLEIFSLLPAVSMCIVLALLFLFGEKWLIIEPKSPQSLKNIYRVLKFAAKHKAPLNRSALTYWEEDIPSRLDLGKMRYGGPFTTEQVEDVKTFFQLLLLFLPLSIVLVSANIFGLFHFSNINHHQMEQDYDDKIYVAFIYNCGGWVLFFVYVACVHCTCLKYKLPSILKQLGFWLFLQTCLNIVYALIDYRLKLSVWLHNIHVCLFTFLFNLVLITSIQFVCAQSPYSMRGFLSGLNFFTLISSMTLGRGIYNSFIRKCQMKHCLIIPYSIGGGLGIVGFLLYLVVAGRYKRRVRDEEYNPYPIIEATYDRYLTQALAPH